MKNKNNGFTLVEILIVVVILGILAAIVIPSFSQASSDSNLTNLKANIQTVRCQIQLYKVQHNDLFPGQSTIGGNIVEADFVSAMTTSDGTYGPYMNSIPANLYIDDLTKRVAVTCVNNASASPSGNEDTGWWINAATGDFRACDSADNTQY